MPLRSETLASYRTRVLREVRDATQQYFNNQGSATPFADIDAWINESIAWRDLWSKGSRSYRAGLALTPGQDQYSLTALFPTETVLDIATVWLIYGNLRVQLDERPFSDVTNWWRAYTNYSDVPGAYCRYGATGLFVGTAPSAAYTLDLDVVVLSTQLVNPADADPLPYPYTEPVVRYAAHLGKLYQRRLDEAQEFLERARMAVSDIEGARTGMLPLAALSPRGTR